MNTIEIEDAKDSLRNYAERVKDDPIKGGRSSDISVIVLIIPPPSRGF